jgi:DNA (cytosine-5)-methyltransferase 1
MVCRGQGPDYAGPRRGVAEIMTGAGRGAYGVRIAKSTALRLPRHPDAPVRQSWRSWASELDGPIAVDLFSGAGGLSLGLEQAGYTTVLAVDHDEWALETHRANFPGPAIDLDLANPDRVDDLMELLTGLKVDLIAGGPPCQPFSRAGRSKIRWLVEEGLRDSVDRRKELWRVFLQAVEEVRPRSVLMENVPDMALGDDLIVVRFIADRLESLGYETEMGLVDAWRYGVPQHRQRLIVVATTDGIFEWPKDSQSPTLRDAIGDLPLLGDSTGERVLQYGGPKSAFQRAARRGVPRSERGVVYDHMTRAVRDDDREAFVLMGEGMRYADLPDELRRYRSDIFDDKYNRLSWDDRSRSITAHIAKDGYWYIHPEEHRTLTVREAARIQTFPDWFRFAGSRSHAFQQIGNAVPPSLATEIAKSLREAAARAAPPREARPSWWRAEVRRRLTEWGREPQPAWRRPGDPWAVLVGVVAGGARSAATVSAGDELLARLPNPEGAASLTAACRRRMARDDDDLQVLGRLAAAGKALMSGTAGGDGWLNVAGLKPASRLWVEAVGLGSRKVVANAASLRVVARLTGTDVDTLNKGSDGKMALGQLVGGGEAVPEITAAIAGLGSTICLPTEPQCDRCPLSILCPSANA